MIKKEYDENSKIKYITKTNTYTDESGTHQMTETEVYKKYYGGAPFYRVWLADLLHHLGLISNSKQMDVLFYVLDNVNSDNLFIGTYRGIEKATGISYKTIAIIFKKMLENDLITQKQRGVYMVKPTLLMKGDNVRKHRLVVEYENCKQKDQE